ncbi:ATP-grasp fold amidoligase family protein [Facklamia miroungae]|uniref:TupA-like ATPgrasp n=1 Tax=Facklamia miroungae TaxID=120956 RepID=A0A1G7PIJ3_9LACT|nr:ATP-grasp fold amidoligase family protein [Facklamia miroungae]NKZ28722.1 glycosyl transferase [Facklamia miroungae]SDF86038.1 TupA-like ATPgrasp [Facklamia miroungae]
MRRKFSFSYLISVFLMHNTFISKFLPDKLYLKFIFKGYTGYTLDLRNPKTFNEKLQWLKLYDRKPIYKKMVDKFEAKEYVAEIIGNEYTIPTLGVWDSFEEINFNELPNKFVLKCTHDSGGLIICKDKSKLDLENAKEKIIKSIKCDYFLKGREWPYKDIKPRIIAEKYIESDRDHDLKDYKFFTFNGKVKAMFIASDRGNANEETKFDFFDLNFNHLNLINGHPNAFVVPNKPEHFNKMIELAEKISFGCPHLRVDFYEVDGKIYFGEMTFFHFSGLVPFNPMNWDELFGSWLNLPIKKK